MEISTSRTSSGENNYAMPRFFGLRIRGTPSHHMKVGGEEPMVDSGYSIGKNWENMCAKLILS